jgi:hypothetical protein
VTTAWMSARASQWQAGEKTHSFSFQKEKAMFMRP